MLVAMKIIIYYVLVGILTTGCVAQMVETKGQDIQLFKPKDQQTRGGVVRYLNTGLTTWKKMRRSDAEKQMQKFCEGAYRIVEEGPRSKFGASMPIGKGVTFETDEYTYVRFECEK